MWRRRYGACSVVRFVLGLQERWPRQCLRRGRDQGRQQHRMAQPHLESMWIGIRAAIGGMSSRDHMPRAPTTRGRIHRAVCNVDPQRPRRCLAPVVDLSLTTFCSRTNPVTSRPCSRRRNLLEAWWRQADAEAGEGQTQQDLARLEQVCDLRCAEQLELREPDGILIWSCDPRLVELEGVVPDLLAGFAQEPFGAEPVQWRQQSVEYGRAPGCGQLVLL